MLPFWLASQLQDKEFVYINLPDHLKPEKNDIFTIDQHALNLNTFSTNFYRQLKLYAKYVDEDTLKLLKGILSKRVDMLGGLALTLNQKKFEFSTQFAKLDTEERNIVLESHKVLKSFKKWENS